MSARDDLAAATGRLQYETINHVLDVLERGTPINEDMWMHVTATEDQRERLNARFRALRDALKDRRKRQAARQPKDRAA